MASTDEFLGIKKGELLVCLTDENELLIGRFNSVRQKSKIQFVILDGIGNDLTLRFEKEKVTVNVKRKGLRLVDLNHWFIIDDKDAEAYTKIRQLLAKEDIKSVKSPFQNGTGFI